MGIFHPFLYNFYLLLSCISRMPTKRWIKRNGQLDSTRRQRTWLQPHQVATHPLPAHRPTGRINHLPILQCRIYSSIAYQRLSFLYPLHHFRAGLSLSCKHHRHSNRKRRKTVQVCLNILWFVCFFILLLFI